MSSLGSFRAPGRPRLSAWPPARESLDFLASLSVFPTLARAKLMSEDPQGFYRLPVSVSGHHPLELRFLYEEPAAHLPLLGFFSPQRPTSSCGLSRRLRRVLVPVGDPGARRSLLPSRGRLVRFHALQPNRPRGFSPPRRSPSAGSAGLLHPATGLGFAALSLATRDLVVPPGSRQADRASTLHSRSCSGFVSPPPLMSPRAAMCFHSAVPFRAFPSRLPGVPSRLTEVRPHRVPPPLVAFPRLQGLRSSSPLLDGGCAPSTEPVALLGLGPHLHPEGPR